MLHPRDVERVESLYVEYGGLVYRRCLRMLHDRDAARVAVQEVFVRYMDQLERERAVGHPRAYLFRTATNLCLNRFRDRKPEQEFAAAEHADQRENDPASLVARRHLLEHGLQRLNEQERLAAWLHYAEGLTQAEVAEVLAVSRKTVNKLLGRVKVRLTQPTAPGEVKHV